MEQFQPGRPKATLLPSGFHSLSEPMLMIARTGVAMSETEGVFADLIYIKECEIVPGLPRVVMHRAMRDPDGSIGYGASGNRILDGVATASHALQIAGYELVN